MSQSNCICQSDTQSGPDKVRLFKMLKQNEASLDKIPFSIERVRYRSVTNSGTDIDEIESQPLTLHPANYLEAGRLWPVSLDINQGNLSLSDLPSLTQSDTDTPYGHKWTNPNSQPIIHPLLLAGVKISTIGITHVLADAMITATELAGNKLWTEIRPLHDNLIDKFSSFQDYLNSKDSLFKYEEENDKISISMSHSYNTVMTDETQLYEDQLIDLQSQTRDINYFSNKIVPRLPSTLVQRILNNTKIQENLVPGSKIHYKIEKKNSFLKINFYLSVFSKETQGIYQFHSLPISKNSKNLYQNFVVKNVTIDNNAFLTGSKGLIEDIVCSRALTTEIPLQIKDVCIKQDFTLPAASLIFVLPNTSFILVKRGTLHKVCPGLPPVTLELKKDIHLLYTSKSCRIQVLFHDGLTWVSQHQEQDQKGFQPILFLEYNLVRESTRYEVLTFWHTFNSFAVLFLVLLLGSIAFALYKLQKLYKLEIFRGSDKTRIQVFRKDTLPKGQSSPNNVVGLYRKKNTRSHDGIRRDNYSTSSSCDQVTVVNNHSTITPHHSTITPNPDEICVLDNCSTHYDADCEKTFLSSVKKAGRKPASHQ